MMKTIDKMIALMTLLFAFSATAQQPLASKEDVMTRISLGTLSGTAKERVYDTDEGGRKLSELDWRYRHAVVVQGSIEWPVRSWLTFGASGWTTVAHSGSKMDDYDWQQASQSRWTDHSSHPNTWLNFANQWDLHLTGWFVHQPDWRLGVMGGYRQSRTSFSAHGGTFSRDNGAKVGRFDDVKVLGYSQRFNMPYVGLTGRYRYGNVEAGTSLKYSRWISAQATDQHYLRSITFSDTTRHQRSFSLSANVGYYVTQQVKLYLESTWDRTLNKKGTNTATFSREGTYARASFKDSAGIEHSSLLTTAGLVYHF
ncbi:omptin family outer membrane protease [Kosakonia sp. CFBP8986]|uniref:omptin family outer membrane protease n=1 Tax=Kosakonia sp. CFBP8986 TaxID=3096524 RepID=UPI002A698D3D|nr:omptin family outer membrane protease [Kosakonia sp. CFBP8986]MDY0888702.1 omptin family outer membrane protease [Kosakonia sp. CFBP8986]